MRLCALPPDPRFPHHDLGFAAVRRSQAARHPDTPLEVLRELARIPELHRYLVARSGVEPEVLSLIAAHSEDPNILRTVARHPRTPPELLATLASRHGSAFKVALALNPKLPAAAAEMLFDSNLPEVLTHLASNTSTPDRILYRLAQKSPVYHRHIVHNPRAGRRTLAYIYQQTPADDSRIFQALAGHPNTPEKVLLALVSTGFPGIQLRLADNRAAPPPVLFPLVCSFFEVVRNRVANHPKVSEFAALRLAKRLADSGLHVGDPYAMAQALRPLLDPADFDAILPPSPSATWPSPPSS